MGQTRKRKQDLTLRQTAGGWKFVGNEDETMRGCAATQVFNSVDEEGDVAMKTWRKILADCERLLPPTNRRPSIDRRPAQRRRFPEAAFRIAIRRNADGGTQLEHLVGGIPKVGGCEVIPVTSQAGGRGMQPDEKEQPIGIVRRRARREDLCVYYRSCDASLILCTLPEKHQSMVMLVSLEGRTTIRQSTLGGKVDRLAFGALTPGRYAVVSFPMVSVDELTREALRLRKQKLYEKALALIEEVLALCPEDPEAWTRKGVMFRNMGCRDEAKIAVTRALEIDDECALAWRLKGALLRDAAQHQQGLECYLRSLELDPTDFLCWENKGNALTALSRTDEAKEAYAEAARMKKIHPEEKF